MRTCVLVVEVVVGPAAHGGCALLSPRYGDAVMSAVFWVVVGTTLVGGLWLIGTGHLLPAAAVLLSGAVLGLVLGVLGRRRSSDIVDLSAGGLRRRGTAMAAGGVIVLVAGIAAWAVGEDTAGRVVSFAGLALTLGSVAVLMTARLEDDAD